MRDWYDKKVHVQSFNLGGEVYILNLRLYQGRTPKWMRRYSDVGTVERCLNDVMYIVSCKQWKKEPRKIMYTC
jgi:hypothetical protein